MRVPSQYYYVERVLRIENTVDGLLAPLFTPRDDPEYQASWQIRGGLSSTYQSQDPYPKHLILQVVTFFSLIASYAPSRNRSGANRIMSICRTETLAHEQLLAGSKRKERVVAKV